MKIWITEANSKMGTGRWIGVGKTERASILDAASQIREDLQDKFKTAKELDVWMLTNIQINSSTEREVVEEMDYAS